MLKPLNVTSPSLLFHGPLRIFGFLKTDGSFFSLVSFFHRLSVSCRKSFSEFSSHPIVVLHFSPPLWIFFFHVATALSGPRPSHYRALTITPRHTTFSRTPVDGWPARGRDLTTHDTRKRQPSIPPAGFEPAIPLSERPQNHALDRAATGIGALWFIFIYFIILISASKYVIISVN